MRHDPQRNNVLWVSRAQRIGSNVFHPSKQFGQKQMLFDLRIVRIPLFKLVVRSSVDDPRQIQGDNKDVTAKTYKKK